MPTAFVHRSPTMNELQKFRLLLSTYQDGTGQLALKNNMSLPGWRDFERSVALAFGGEAQESKAIFDVLLSDSTGNKVYYGISCKMRETLRYVEKVGRVTIEVSNASGKFWNALKTNGFNEENYKHHPQKVGEVLITLVESWHRHESIDFGGNIDLTGSFYLVLQWDKRSGYYRLYQFPLVLPNPEALSWEVDSKRLVGRDDQGVIIEWYGHSGGQLKYYPFASNANWSSSPFQLELLPTGIEHGILRKAADYFPELWRKADEEL